MENPVEQFRMECEQEIEAQGNDKVLEKLSYDWAHQAATHKYGYHFTWLGRPIIQYPTDILAMQEIIWQVKPDVIVVLYHPSYGEPIEWEGHKDKFDFR